MMFRVVAQLYVSADENGAVLRRLIHDPMRPDWLVGLVHEVRQQRRHFEVIAMTVLRFRSAFAS